MTHLNQTNFQKMKTKMKNKFKRIKTIYNLSVTKCWKWSNKTRKCILSQPKRNQKLIYWIILAVIFWMILNHLWNWIRNRDLTLKKKIFLKTSWQVVKNKFKVNPNSLKILREAITQKSLKKKNKKQFILLHNQLIELVNLKYQQIRKKVLLTNQVLKVMKIMNK